MPNQIDEFFEGLPSSESKSEGELDLGNGTPATPAEGANKDEVTPPAKDDEPRKNRRHRRLEQQLQEEREARIRAEALAEGRSESSKFSNDTSDVDARWIQIYGDTPEARQAWKLQSDILNDYKAQAKEEALQEVKEQQVESARQQKQFESFIDSELEEIEDEFNVDVTSDSPAARKARREFLEMVQQASPKDDNGTITAYADFGTVWEFYQLKQAKNKDKGSNERQKDISSLSMSKSNGGTSGEPTITPGFDGWRKDYGLN